MEYRHQVVIACPVSRVFAFMDDVTREREWQPGILEAEKIPPGETHVGTRKRYVSRFMGRRLENTYVTTLFEVDRRVSYETTSASALHAQVHLTFEPAGEGTRVIMAVRGKPSGPLRFVPTGILEAVFRKELGTSLDALRKILEGAV